MANAEPVGVTAAPDTGALEIAQRRVHDVRVLTIAKAREARRLAEQATDDVMRFIAARPVVSVLIGVAAGYLLGTLATREALRRLEDRRRAAAFAARRANSRNGSGSASGRAAIKRGNNRAFADRLVSRSASREEALRRKHTG